MINGRGLMDARMPETARIRDAYSGRVARLTEAGLYSPANEAHLFAIQGRQRALLRALRQEGLWPLGDKDILEVGCGGGNVLLELLGYEADPRRLRGVDLLAERVAVARRRLPHLALGCASGAYLPYADQSFDLVLQFTVFSSILDRGICYTVANEIRRVLRPGGAILWYDFWVNPVNKHTRGIRPAEIRSYFPDSRYRFDRITLAPPLARRLVPRSWSGALFLENLRVLNTHYLAVIRPIE
jgi:ubiquinone/menaquinone biosynthesis C-methylase UbiE